MAIFDLVEELSVRRKSMKRDEIYQCLACGHTMTGLEAFELRQKMNCPACDKIKISKFKRLDYYSGIEDEL